MADATQDDWAPVSGGEASAHADDWAPVSEQPGAAEDVGKTLAGNVVPTAVANAAAGAISAPATVGSYMLQGGIKGGEYLTQDAINAMRRHQGLPEYSDEEFAGQQKDFKNAIRQFVGLKPSDESGDLADSVPTPQNLVSSAAKAVGTPLYQPKTEAGQATETVGNVLSGGMASGAKAAPAIAGAVGAAGGQDIAKQLGGSPQAQFWASLLGGSAGGAAGAKAPTAAEALEVAQHVQNEDVAQPTPKPEYKPIDTLKGINSSYEDALDRANTYYDLPKTIAGNKAVSAPEVRGYLSDVINEIKNDPDPFNKAKSIVSGLQRTHEMLPEDGTVPVQTLLELRQASNKNFKPGVVNDKTSVYSGLNRAVNSGLDSAKDNIPHFEDALNVADDHWINGVKVPFLDNDVLQKVWKPEDSHNMSQYESGKVDTIPDDTSMRANKLASKVQDVDTYNAVRRALPPDQGEQFDSAVLKNALQGSQDSRVRALGMSIANGATGHIPSMLRNMADIIKPRIDPQTKALVQAIKKQNTYTPLAQSGAARAQNFQNVSNAYDKSQNPPILALPAPKPSAVEVPPGGFKTTYSPTDLNAPDEPGFQGGDKPISVKPDVQPDEKPWVKNPYSYKKGGIVKKSMLDEHDMTHPQWVKFVKDHGKKFGYTLKDKHDADAVKFASWYTKGGKRASVSQ